MVPTTLASAYTPKHIALCDTMFVIGTESPLITTLMPITPGTAQDKARLTPPFVISPSLIRSLMRTILSSNPEFYMTQL